MALAPHDNVGLPNILIVDDRADNLLVLEAVLADCREYNVVTAASGFEAIELVKERDFAAILLDIQMPVMDGYEAATRIKALERGKDIPIIMVSAIFKEDPHILKGYAAGAIDYIGKPFNPDVLKAKVGVYANLYLKSRLVEALREQQNTRILETLPVGVIVADKTGLITQMNKEAETIWSGRRFVEIKHYRDYVGWRPKSGEPVKPHEWAMARAIEKRERSQGEIVDIQCFDNTRKTIWNSASPITGRQGENLGAVEVLQDITHHGGIQTALAKDQTLPGLNKIAS
jgi:CheY-like chemotaxis protein